MTFEPCESWEQATQAALEWEDLVLSWTRVTRSLLDDCGLSYLPGVELAG